MVATSILGLQIRSHYKVKFWQSNKVTTIKTNTFLKGTSTNSCLKCIPTIHGSVKLVLETQMFEHFENS